MNQPRLISSARPFQHKARVYKERGWANVFPLPAKQKDPPPTGFTGKKTPDGRKGKDVTWDQLENWLADPKHEHSNVGLHLGLRVEIDGIEYETLGLDVDENDDNPEKPKRGYSQLKHMEEKFGKLPDTWTASARTNGKAGTRFFLVPTGLEWRGYCAEAGGRHIDVIQLAHRYQLVYPSFHPKGGQYLWYPPGVLPTGMGALSEIDWAALGFELNGGDICAIPRPRDLAILPEKWIDFLSRDRTPFADALPIDMDSTTKDLNAWMKREFVSGTAQLCSFMQRQLEVHLINIAQNEDHHYPLQEAHWNLFHLGAEGHSGWITAVKQIEAAWLERIKSEGRASNRDSLAHAMRECRRSREGVIRKLRGKANELKELGVAFINKVESCMTADEIAPPKAKGDNASGGGNHWVNSIPLLFKDFDPNSYGCNDLEQAQHLFDRVGDNLRYIADYNAWVLYDGKTWHIDDFANVRDLFDRACIQTSLRRSLSLGKKAEKYLEGAGNSKSDVEYTKLVKAQGKLLKIADVYRNDNKIKAALNCLKSIPGVAMRYNELNWDTTILAMPNGKCLRLEEPSSKPKPNAKGYSVIDNDKSFLTTMMTAVELREAGSITEREKRLWKGYLDLFLPDLEYRRFVQKALGYILIGGNPDKLALFLVGTRNTGKSTMLQCIQGALKDYGATFQPNSVFKDSSSGNNPELGNLLHKRGIFSSESGSQRIYANPLKRNTGGDKISVTRKYANAQIIGIPHFIPVVATNQPPTIDDADEALVKRIMVLPFEIQVSDSQNDKRADTTIPRDAQHAIFSWLVGGYKRYVREGLSYNTWPQKVVAATLEFAAELSDVSTFLSEHCISASDEVKQVINDKPKSVDDEQLRKDWSRISTGSLYKAYHNECMTNDQKPMAIRPFGKKVRQVFGVVSIPRTVNGVTERYYLGLRMQTEADMNQYAR